MGFKLWAGNFKLWVAIDELRQKKVFFLLNYFKTVTWVSEVGFKKFKRVNNLILNHKFNQNKRIAKRGRKNSFKKSNEVKMAQEYWNEWIKFHW